MASQVERAKINPFKYFVNEHDQKEQAEKSKQAGEKKDAIPPVFELVIQVAPD
jgi:hypothetical protein